MNTETAISPKYDSEHVGRAVLLAVIDLLPVHLTVPELSLRIAADPHDTEEVSTIADATHDLRRCGLVRYRNDDLLVEPTQAALRAFALLSP